MSTTENEPFSHCFIFFIFFFLSHIDPISAHRHLTHANIILLLLLISDSINYNLWHPIYLYTSIKIIIIIAIMKRYQHFRCRVCVCEYKAKNKSREREREKIVVQCVCGKGVKFSVYTYRQSRDILITYNVYVSSNVIYWKRKTIKIIFMWKVTLYNGEWGEFIMMFLCTMFDFKFSIKARVNDF